MILNFNSNLLSHIIIILPYLAQASACAVKLIQHFEPRIRRNTLMAQIFDIVRQILPTIGTRGSRKHYERGVRNEVK